MRLPGFSAEASLYRAGEQSPTMTSYDINALLISVVPAMPCCSACDRACDRCEMCLDTSNPSTCRQICVWCNTCFGHCSPSC